MRLIIFLLSLFFTLSIHALNFIKVVDSKNHLHQFTAPNIAYDKVIFTAVNDQGILGIYTNLWGNLQCIVDTNTLAPQSHQTFISFGNTITSQNTYQYITLSSPALDQNQIAFLAIDKKHQAGIYRYDKKELHTIVQQSASFKNLSHPLINKGQILFQANQNDIYLYDQEQLKKLFDASTHLPQLQETFMRLWNPDLSDSVVAFNGKNNKGQDGIYANFHGQLTMLVDHNTYIPKTKTFFISFGGPSLQGDTVVFRGFGKNIFGIYTAQNHHVETLADNKTHIPHTQNYFTGLFNPTYDHMLTVFRGTDAKRKSGIYLWEKGKIQKIIAESDWLDGKKIRYVRLGENALSNRTIAFIAVFEDSSEGIFTTSLPKT